ncbi:MAG: hypothetical protein RQ736_12040 [Thiogranum sp.]|nr:hypothetical protein [Thiogranum sp.]
MKQALRIGWKPQNYESRVASVRIRCLNSIRELRAQGFPVELYRDRHQKTYKSVVFSKAYNARDIELAERLKSRGTRIIFDLCDNHFLLSDERVDRLARMFAIADCWVVSSQAMADVVRRKFDSTKPLWVIEDAVEEHLNGQLLDVRGRLQARWQLRGLRGFLDSVANRKAVHLVWFGNHKASYGDSGLAHVRKLRPLLEKLHVRRPLTVSVISNSRDAFNEVFRDWKIPVYYIDWSAHTFLAALKLHDVAVIPIDVNEFTEVKTNNRIALSLNQGLGVVADSIPSYRVFSDCSFLDNWEQGLTAYMDHPQIIEEHVRCARHLIHEQFSIPVIAARWRSLFDSVQDAIAG